MCHIRECVTCQQKKDEHTHQVGLLYPLPIPEHKWESVSMDFITILLKAQGKDFIFVVVDQLTKFSHFFSISMDYRAFQVEDLFLEKYSGCMGYLRRL
jgi:hypothetical protein